jgi:hypothetical protein
MNTPGGHVDQVQAPGARMRSRRPARSLRYVVSGALVAALLAAGFSWLPTPPPLRSTFLQLHTANLAWPREKWQELFRHLQSLQVNEVIVQWTVYEDRPFYGSDQEHAPVLDLIMDLAAAGGMRVWLGLVYDPQFWSQIQREPALVDVYLRRLRLRCEEAARHLAAAYPQLYGWYIATEIDDKHWQKHEAQDVLFDFLRDLTTQLRQLKPGAPVAISGFSNALMDPDTLAGFWKNIVYRGNINLVLFQDGIGAKKLTLETLPLYLQALARGMQQQGRQLQVVVELFEQVQAEPFRARPASWERLKQQISLARRYGTPRLTAFSIPDYLWPAAGAAAGQLCEEYQSYWQGGRSRP